MNIHKKKELAMVLNEDLKLNDGLYYKVKTQKRIIVLHHTVSKREAGAGSVVRWWNASGRPVATPFIIDADGQIYRIFNEEYWCYHTGLGKWFDTVAIGIELVNEGPLVLKGSRYLTTFGSIYEHGVYTHTQMWRGYIYFAEYPQPQIESLAQLVVYLCDKYKIPKKVYQPFFEYTLPDKILETGGIIAHSSIRADKTDVSVAFPLEHFISLIS